MNQLSRTIYSLSSTHLFNELNFQLKFYLFHKQSLTSFHRSTTITFFFIKSTATTFFLHDYSKLEETIS